jgi:hypothetical protein
VSFPVKKKINTVYIGSDVRSDVTPSESASQLSQSSIVKWVSQTDEKFKTVLDEAVAKCFYDTGIPFNFADSHAFKNLVKLLRPSYEPPSANVIANGLLKRAHDKLDSQVDEVLKNSRYISLVSDGWSNSRTEHMVNYVAVTPRLKPILIDAVETGETSQSGEEIAAGIERQIFKVGNLFLDKL